MEPLTKLDGSFMSYIRIDVLIVKEDCSETYDPHAIEWHDRMVVSGHIGPPLDRFRMCEVRKYRHSGPYLSHVGRDHDTPINEQYPITMPVIGSVPLNLLMNMFLLRPSSYGG
jgi:hypothetical protein